MSPTDPSSPHESRSPDVASDGMRHRMAVWWAWFTDLGAGAFFLVLGVIVVIVVLVGVVIGKQSSPQAHPCDQARATVHRMEGIRGPVTAPQAAQLHQAATKLRSYADGARGDEAKVIRDAADVAASAQAGKRLDVTQLSVEFDVTCSTGGFGAGA